MTLTSEPVIVSFNALKRRALSLGAANAFDYAMQFLLPVVLVRYLAPEAFGQYRLMWLAVMTVMVVAPLNMPQVLYYFMPRLGAKKKQLHVHMTLIYLVVAGLLGGLLVGPWNPLLPDGMRSLAEFGWLVPAVVVLFVTTFMLDMLPTIEERVHWQAGITIAMSLLRTLTLAWAAWAPRDLHILIALLLAVLLLKLLILIGYIHRWHGLSGAWFARRPFVEQLSHAAPFGASSTVSPIPIVAKKATAGSDSV